jgi:hypothetical protein
MRHKPGHLFAKKAGAGFVGEPLPRCVIGPAEENVELSPCLLCTDPACIEWPNCYVLGPDDKPIGGLYHVSECQMLPITPGTLNEFVVEIHGTVTLTKEDVWPDGNGPENPTAQDVMLALREIAMTPSQIAHEIGLGVELTVDGVPVCADLWI